MHVADTARTSSSTRPSTFIERNREAPFFLYLAPDAVHEPAEAPDRLIEKHRRRGSSNPAYAAMVETVDDRHGPTRESIEAAWTRGRHPGDLHLGTTEEPAFQRRH